MKVKDYIILFLLVLVALCMLKECDSYKGKDIAEIKTDTTYIDRYIYIDPDTNIVDIDISEPDYELTISELRKELSQTKSKVNKKDTQWLALVDTSSSEKIRSYDLSYEDTSVTMFGTAIVQGKLLNYDLRYFLKPIPIREKTITIEKVKYNNRLYVGPQITSTPGIML